MSDASRLFEEMDRRGAPRRRTLKSARIETLDGKTAFDCEIRNESETGALLLMLSTLDVPDQFILSVPCDNVSHRCEVAWKDLTHMGVIFLTETEAAVTDRYCGL